MIETAPETRGQPTPEATESPKGLRYRTAEFFKNYGYGVGYDALMIAFAASAAISENPNVSITSPVFVVGGVIGGLYLGYTQKQGRDLSEMLKNPEKYRIEQRARWIAEGRVIGENGLPLPTEAELAKAENKRLKMERAEAREAERRAAYVPTSELKGFARFKRRANERAFYFLAARH